MNKTTNIIGCLLAVAVILATALLYNHWGRWQDLSLNQQFNEIQQLVENKDWSLVGSHSMVLINRLNKLLIDSSAGEQHHSYWIMLGELMIYNGEFNAALNSYRQAIALKPKDEFLVSRIEQIQQLKSHYQQVDNQSIETATDLSGTLTASIAIADSVDRQLISPNATVFAYVRAYNGAPRPLAIKRFQVSDLPLVVGLTENDQMMQSGLWNSNQQFEWVVRISNSGNASPQSGDIQGLYSPVRLGDSITIQIDQVIR